MEEYLRVGVFTSTHGLKGEINVYPTTDDVSRFDYLDRVFMDTKKDGLIELHAAGARYRKGMVILKFKEYDDINQIEKYKGSDLLVSREDAVPLEEGEFFISDIIGLQAYEGERYLGTVKDVLQTGANDVYIIEKPEGKELLIPVIPECILDTDLGAGRLEVHLIDGLEDL